MRIFISIVLFALFFFLLFLGAGYLSPVEYQKSKSALFDDKEVIVWNAIVDIEKYLETKNNLQKIEITERNFDAIKSWKEFYSRNEILDYTIIEKDEPRLFIINVNDNFRKINRDIEYFIERENNKTKLTVTEISKAEHIFWRGVTTLLGRDNFIDRQLKWVRVALFEKLLDNN